MKQQSLLTLWLVHSMPWEVSCVRSKNVVTLVSQYPYRHIQIILRLYRSPAEVLMGFDVDCCSVGFDGKTVWALPRAREAFIRQQNSVDMTRRSPSYEMRLAKYSERGFEVCAWHGGLAQHPNSNIL